HQSFIHPRAIHGTCDGKPTERSYHPPLLGGREYHRPRNRNHSLSVRTALGRDNWPTGDIVARRVCIYEETGPFAPAHTALSLGQTSISEALGDLTDKVDGLDPTLPLLYSEGMPGSTATAITAASWANIAGTNLSITLPKKAVVEVSTNAWLQIASFSTGSV